MSIENIDMKSLAINEDKAAAAMDCRITFEVFVCAWESLMAIEEHQITTPASFVET